MNKRLRLLLAVVLLIAILSLRHDSGRGMQRLGEVEAQIQLNRWYIFGKELYAHDQVGVFPSGTETDIQRGQALLQRKRLLGFPLGKQDDLLNLDGSVPGRDAKAFRYILQTKMKSDDPQDRIWFTQMLWSEWYPGNRADVESLLQDTNDKVRQAAKERLEVLKRERGQQP